MARRGHMWPKPHFLANEAQRMGETLGAIEILRQCLGAPFEDPCTFPSIRHTVISYDTPQGDRSRCEDNPIEDWASQRCRFWQYPRDVWGADWRLQRVSVTDSCPSLTRIVPLLQRLCSNRPPWPSTSDPGSSQRLVLFPIKSSFNIFADFTSAFIIPQNLTQKLHTLGLNPQCNWILDVLTGHSQSVSITPSNITLSAGSIQGCVPSPLLFAMLTYVCRMIVPSCFIYLTYREVCRQQLCWDTLLAEYWKTVEHLKHWFRENL